MGIYFYISLLLYNEKTYNFIIQKYKKLKKINTNIQYNKITYFYIDFYIKNIYINNGLRKFMELIYAIFKFLF